MILEGKPQSWIEGMAHVSYKTYRKVRDGMQMRGEWPVKPITRDEFKRKYLEACNELVREGKTTSAELAARSQLLPDGTVPP